jgi:Fic family protein
MKSLEKPPTIDNISFNQMYNDAEVDELVTRINEEYYYWDKVKYLPVPENITSEKLWYFAKFYRNTSAHHLSFGNYKFRFVVNNWMQKMLHHFDLNIGGSLSTGSLIPKEDKDRYLVNSVMEEAIASSQIEGAVTTRKEAKDMLRKSRSPRNKSEQMILNNYKTIQYILEIKDEPLTAERLLAVHQKIANDTLDEQSEEGVFRMSDNINVVDVMDSEIVYTPPQHTEINGLINDLCDFFNKDEGDFVHPIIKACSIHFMIGFIHPFTDGNGRTARALFYWYLLKKGYWLTEYLSISKLILESKDQYAKAYLHTEIDQNDLTYFILYKLRKMQQAYDALREYIGRKLEEKKQVTIFQKLDGINERQALILKWYYEEPSLLLTVKEIENRLQVSNQTARADLQGLSDLSFIEAISLNKKTQAFTRARGFDGLLRGKLDDKQLDLH